MPWATTTVAQELLEEDSLHGPLTGSIASGDIHELKKELSRESARLRSQVSRYQQLLTDCQAIAAENELNSSRSVGSSTRAACDVELDRLNLRNGHEESKLRARSTEATCHALGAASTAAQPRIETRTSHLKGLASQTVALCIGQQSPLVARPSMMRPVSPLPQPCPVSAPSLSPGAYIVEPVSHERSPIQTSPCLPAWPAYPDSPTLPRPTSWFVASPQASVDSMAAASFANRWLARSVSPIRREPLVSQLPGTALQPLAQQHQQPTSSMLRSPCSLAGATVAPPVVLHQAVQPAVVWSAAPRTASPVRHQLPPAEQLVRTLREQAAKQLATSVKALTLRQMASALARWWRAAEEENLGEYATAAMLSKLAAYDRAARGHDRVGSILSAAMATEGQRAAYHSRTLSVLLGLRQLTTFVERRGRQDSQAAFQQLAAHRPVVREISISFDELAAKNGLRKSVFAQAKEASKKRVEFQSVEVFQRPRAQTFQPDSGARVDDFQAERLRMMDCE
eukprot:TRINITY_DN24505_c0_g2_i1.p1 TRINITY_DN24505_c0_g2~~TRINITY_DN24505_c0_g2_i1.p1  ORF type:complete len:511 (-),score=102.41 TRINITY_DN24505_c0_g2_i1:70-1602(-)